MARERSPFLNAAATPAVDLVLHALKRVARPVIYSAILCSFTPLDVMLSKLVRSSLFLGLTFAISFHYLARWFIVMPLPSLLRVGHISPEHIPKDPSFTFVPNTLLRHAVRLHQGRTPGAGTAAAPPPLHTTPSPIN